jgi:hypothetical protein
MPVTTYLAAAVVASLASIKAFKHPHLAYWWKWDRVLIVAALTSIVLIYAASGVAVTALATHLGWRVIDSGTGSWVANGAVYGAAAVALLRLEVTSFGLASISPARVIFNGVLDRLEGTLDAACARAVPRKVGDLTARQLCRVSWQLFRKYVDSDASLKVAVKLADALELRKRHHLALRRLSNAPADAEVIEAQEDLRFTCADLIVRNYDATIDFPPHDVPS